MGIQTTGKKGIKSDDENHNTHAPYLKIGKSFILAADYYKVRQ